MDKGPQQNEIFNRETLRDCCCCFTQAQMDCGGRLLAALRSSINCVTSGLKPREVLFKGPLKLKYFFLDVTTSMFDLRMSTN